MVLAAAAAIRISGTRAAGRLNPGDGSLRLEEGGATNAVSGCMSQGVDLARRQFEDL